VTSMMALLHETPSELPVAENVPEMRRDAMMVFLS
jgi:hypothetical protein